MTTLSESRSSFPADWDGALAELDALADVQRAVRASIAPGG